MVCQRYVNREQMSVITSNNVPISQAAKVTVATEVEAKVSGAEKGSANIKTSSESDTTIAELNQKSSTEVTATVRRHLLILLVYSQITSREVLWLSAATSRSGNIGN